MRLRDLLSLLLFERDRRVLRTSRCPAGNFHSGHCSIVSDNQTTAAFRVKHGVERCADYQWKVVTQSVDSSNIAVYGSSEPNFYCDGNTRPAVLPVHAVWADVTGSVANTYDPSWKPLSAQPRGHECEGKDPLQPDGIPTQGIRPCDDRPDTKLPGPAYWPVVSSVYNRLTQPGATQDTVSIAPHAISNALTMSVIANRLSVCARWSLRRASVRNWRPVRPLSKCRARSKITTRT